MIIKKILETEIKLEDLKISINLDLSKENYTIIAKYNCPKCSGYGCNHHNHINDDCNNGDVILEINPLLLSKCLEPNVILKIQNILNKLQNDYIIGD